MFLDYRIANFFSRKITSLDLDGNLTTTEVKEEVYDNLGKINHN